MKVKLLTHNDLDGSGCVFDCQLAFGKDNVDWEAHNYDTIDDAVTNQIVNDPTITKRYDLIIIADISPDEPVAWELDKLGATNIWQFDHHKTRAFADRFSWVVFDMSRCGAKILFDWLLREGFIDMTNEVQKYSKFMDAVNAYDIWNEADIANKAWGDSLTRLHNMLGQKAFISLGWEMVVEMEEKLRDFIQEQEKDMINTACDQAVKVTDENGRECIATISTGPSPQIGHELLKRYPTARYAMVVQPTRGTTSLYSRSGEYDVSTLAQARHPKGGGHPNASGYSLPDGAMATMIKAAMK